jgi:ribosome-associated toxin RatA of RatAB toxin-antitoxin module
MTREKTNRCPFRVSRWCRGAPTYMRYIVPILLLTLRVTAALAEERTQVVEVGGHTVLVKVIESFDDVSTIRAECVIPRPQKEVWRVLADYDHLEDIVPVVQDSRIVGDEDGYMIVRQEGRAGLWVFKRGFTVTFRVREVPMAYIGFDAFEGDFRRFKGTWQIEQREAGTWVAHKVEIQPRFFAPRWAMRRVARRLMAETIDGVIRRCLSADPSAR